MQRATTAQLNGSPARRYYTGSNAERARSVSDLRARAHKLMPGFVLEYLEGGAGEEATLARERSAFAEWRVMPRTLAGEAATDVSVDILGRRAAMPVAIAPTGLNGIFTHHADLALAEAGARSGVPFVQSTMSNDRMEDVAQVPGLRHWWQLYVFGGDEIWQELVARADSAGCEALVLTTNAQVFGQREWDKRRRTQSGFPDTASLFDAAMHPRWLVRTLRGGLPQFANVIDFVPRDRRSFFDSARWIREQMRTSLSWEDIAKIRQRWPRPLLVKGILNLEDVSRALDSGVDGIILGSHGGRQADSAISALDILESARDRVGDRLALHMSGGIRRGIDVLKARALGAEVVFAGRAPLYGLCAHGADGTSRALDLLRSEILNELAQCGVSSLERFSRDLLVKIDDLPLPSAAAG